jgi:hypothetical protein
VLKAALIVACILLVSYLLGHGLGALVHLRPGLQWKLRLVHFLSRLGSADPASCEGKRLEWPLRGRHAKPRIARCTPCC